MSRVSVGDKAPDFKAAGTGDSTYSLSQYRGRPVILVFYPGDATPVCTEQLISYSNDFASFQELGAEVLAISPQDVKSHESFRSKHQFRFPLLFDEGKRIGSAYGVLGPLGFYRRSLFVVDALGVIRYAKRATAGLGYVKSPALVEALKEAGATPVR